MGLGHTSTDSRDYQEHLTQTDLARRAGIRTETLRRLEKEKSTPDVDAVDKIIRMLERVDAKTST